MAECAIQNIKRYMLILTEEEMGFLREVMGSPIQKPEPSKNSRIRMQIHNACISGNVLPELRRSSDPVFSQARKEIGMEE